MKIKNICCIGAGYVGGPTMAVIAYHCPEIKITVVDSNENRINAWNGNLENLPVYEPGLPEVVKKVRDKNLFFSSNIKKAIEESEMIFMAVNTPTKTKGEGAGMAADLSFVELCANEIAKYSRSNKIVIEKSTLPVRTAEKIKEILSKNHKINFEVLSNPEFLAEGTAIKDLFKSDRVLIGGDNTKSGNYAVNKLSEIYNRWIPKEKIITTNIWSSELAKLASNAMLAQRISSINSLSALCEKTGAEINELSRAIGSDHRIGKYFLKASVGFGGSCFKKDILNLVYLSKHYGLDEVAEYWHQVVKINDYQKNRFVKKIISSIKTKKTNPKISILGWAFKANTNDSRESPAIYVTAKLLEKNNKIHIYDPKVSGNQILNDLSNLLDELKVDPDQFLKNVFIHNSLDSIIKDSDIIAVMTEWEIFRNIDYSSADKDFDLIDGRFFISK